MAGAENTIEIRRDFLMGGTTYSNFIGGDSNLVIKDLHLLLSKPDTSTFFQQDMSNGKEAMNFIKKFLGIDVGDQNEFPYYQSLLQDFDSAYNFTMLRDNRLQSSKWAIAQSMARTYVKIAYLANRLNFNGSISNSLVGLAKIKGPNFEVLIDMYKTFLSKIKTSVNLDKVSGINYQGSLIPKDLKSDEIDQFIDNTIMPVFKTYFDPYETIGLRPIRKDPKYRARNGVLKGNLHTGIVEESWKLIFKKVLIGGYSLKNLDETSLASISKKLESDQSVDKTETAKSKKVIINEMFLKETDFIQKNGDINYSNPLHIIFTAYIIYIHCVVHGLKVGDDLKLTNMKNRHKHINTNFGSEKLEAKNVNRLYLLLVMGVVTRYINTIVNQGNGIVTTLEHLKYYFLYNTKDRVQLINYNEKFDDKRQLHNKGNKRLTGSNTWENIDDTGMFEEVENGMFQQYKTLEILAQYATKKPELTLNDDGFEGKKNSDVDNQETDFLYIPSTDGNKYIMLTAILRGRVVPIPEGSKGDKITDVTIGEVNKYCMATKNTLEFAHSITSVPGPCADVLEGKPNEESILQGLTIDGNSCTKVGGFRSKNKNTLRRKKHNRFNSKRRKRNVKISKKVRSFLKNNSGFKGGYRKFSIKARNKKN